MDVWHILFTYGLLPTILGLGAFIVKSHVSWKDSIEKELNTKLDEADVRILMSDKIDPIREDIQELKAKLDKIMDILLRQNR